MRGLARGRFLALFVLLSPLLCWKATSAAGVCDQSLTTAALHIKRMKEQGEMTSFLVYSGIDKVFRKSFGVPFWIHSMKAGQMIFRRYMEAEYLEPVIRASRLSFGDCPYVVQSECYREEFPDLVGLFFTTRSYRSEAVGLQPNMPYVDFKLAPHTEVFRLEPGIYLIPKVSLTSSILKQIQTARADEAERLKQELDAAKRKERELRESLFVPIQILSVSR